LAMLFLFEWPELVHNQIESCRLFPRRLVDVIITDSSDWSRYSRRLLLRFNPLDSKGTHPFVGPLLSAETLQIESCHWAQIISSSKDEAVLIALSSIFIVIFFLLASCGDKIQLHQDLLRLQQSNPINHSSTYRYPYR
jgi:hypothetical protein